LAKPPASLAQPPALGLSDICRPAERSEPGYPFGLSPAGRRVVVPLRAVR
jgi:hypothetical protein